jgi:hypothetical protein
VIRSSAFAVPPAASVTVVADATVDRDAAAPICVTGDPPASATPGYPYSVHGAPEMFVKSMTWYIDPAAPWATPRLAFRPRVAQPFEDPPEDAPDDTDEAGDTDEAVDDTDDAGDAGAEEADDALDVPAELVTDAELAEAATEAEGDPLLHPATTPTTRPTPPTNAPLSIVCRIHRAEVIHRSSLHIRPHGRETAEMPLPPQAIHQP